MPLTHLTIDVPDLGDNSKNLEVEGAIAVGEKVAVSVTGLPADVSRSENELRLRVLGPMGEDVATHGGWNYDGTKKTHTTTLDLASVQAFRLFFPPPPPPRPHLYPRPPAPPMPLPPPGYDPVATATAMQPPNAVNVRLVLELRDKAGSDSDSDGELVDASLIGTSSIRLNYWPADWQTATLVDLANGRVYSKEEVDALLAEEARIRGTADSAEAAARIAGDAATLASANEHADSAIQAEAAARRAAIESEAAARQQADAALGSAVQTAIDTANSKVSSVNGKTGVVTISGADMKHGAPSNPFGGPNDTVAGALMGLQSKKANSTDVAESFQTQGALISANANSILSLQSGKADLVGGKVPASQLPSYVDDVLEHASLSAFPATGEAGKIYVALDTNKTYRWSGSEYVQIGGGEIPVPVAPSTDQSAAGKPADAKATGDALAAKASDSNVLHVLGEETKTGILHVAPAQGKGGVTIGGQNNSSRGELTVFGDGATGPYYIDASKQAKLCPDKIVVKDTSLSTPERTFTFPEVGGSLVAGNVVRTAQITDDDYPSLSQTLTPDADGAISFPTADTAYGTLGLVRLESWDGTSKHTAANANHVAEIASSLASHTHTKNQITDFPPIPDVSGKADSASLAPPFSTSLTYAVGDHVTYEGLLYKCTTAVSTAGAWNAANWTAVAVTDEMGADTPLPFDAEVDYVTVPAGAYILPEAYGVSPEMEVSITVRLPSSGVSTTNDFFCGNWRGASSSSTQLKIVGDTTAKVMSFSSGESSLTVSSGVFGKFSTMSLGGNKFSVDSASASISVGNTVAQPCDFGIGACAYPDGTTPTGRAFDFDISAFQFFSATANRNLVPVRVGQTGYLYDKVSGRLFGSAVSGTPLVPGPDKATPTIATPGRIVELTPAIRYAFASPTPSVSGTAATVACEDRAINDFTVATGITSLTITPPAAVTGRARDFFCRVTLTDSSLPTVTLSGATIDIGATEVAGMVQGVNLLMFTEIASGHWLASRRSAS